MKNEEQDFLLEIGTEELPPKSLLKLAQSLSEIFRLRLEKENLKYKRIQYFASPRRLALLVFSLETQQETQWVERLGPQVEGAFSKNGSPTLACLGFAKSCGISADELIIKDTKKGKRVACRIQQAGQKTIILLPGLVQSVLRELPIAKAMRWGSHAFTFIRPVHWVLMLLGKEIIPASLFNLKAGRETFGHRFHHPRKIMITQPKEYQQLLQTNGMVIADFHKREQNIQKQIKQIAEPYGEAIIDPNLLNEVTAMVEWPVALVGAFKSEFLKVPAEALIVAMKMHQKCFPIINEKKALQPYFILVSNIESKNPQTVVAGNERVINARLADAAFFYHQDLKTPLFNNAKKLEHVIFQRELGSLGDKTHRIIKLSHFIAKAMAINVAQAEHAASLAKCDLVSDMVMEFPELQGIMGYYYALADKIPKAVAIAIKEHYLPRFSGDNLPTTEIGACVALADRIDTLVGILGINKIPTGEKDPFGLRRLALGILRILIEKRLGLDLYKLIQFASQNFSCKLPNANVIEQTFQFCMDRLRTWYLDQAISPDVYACVNVCQPSSPLDFDLRLHAVQQFQKLPEATALTAANKRVSNILKKEMVEKLPAKINPELFEFEAERELAKLLVSHETKINVLCEKAEYTQALTILSQLKQPIDIFFDKVMIMVEDKKVRNNRLALLASIKGLFTQIADISLLSPS